MRCRSYCYNSQTLFEDLTVRLLLAVAHLDLSHEYHTVAQLRQTEQGLPPEAQRCQPLGTVGVEVVEVLELGRGVLLAEEGAVGRGHAGTIVDHFNHIEALIFFLRGEG